MGGEHHQVGSAMADHDLNPVRAEALRLAVQLCGHGNWENISRRSDATLAVADLFVAWLGKPPSREAAANAISARKAG